MKGAIRAALAAKSLCEKPFFDLFTVYLPVLGLFYPCFRPIAAWIRAQAATEFIAHKHCHLAC